MTLLGFLRGMTTFVVEGRKRPLSEMVGGKFYHGSPHELPVGTILQPGKSPRNYKQSKAVVSLTSDLVRAADWGSLGWKVVGYVYEVEPLGDMEVHRATPANYGENFILWEVTVPRARIVALVKVVQPKAEKK